MADALDSITDPFFLRDIQSRFTYLNGTAEQYLREGGQNCWGANSGPNFPALWYSV